MLCDVLIDDLFVSVDVCVVLDDDGEVCGFVMLC